MPQKKSSSKTTAKKSNSRTKAPVRPQHVRSEAELLRDKEIVGIIITACAVMMLISFVMAPADTKADVNTLGLVSAFIVRLLRSLGGGGAVMLPLALLLLGVLTVADRNHSSSSRLAGLVLLLLAVLGLLQLKPELLPFKEYVSQGWSGTGGGAIGALLDFALQKTVGRAGAIVVFIAMLTIGLLLFFQTSARAVFSSARRGAGSLHGVVSSHHQSDQTDGFTDLTAAEQRIDSRLRGLDEESGSGKRGRKSSKAAAIPTPLVGDAPAPHPRPQPKKTRFAHDYLPDITVDKRTTGGLSATSATSASSAPPQSVPAEDADADFVAATAAAADIADAAAAPETAPVRRSRSKRTETRHEPVLVFTDRGSEVLAMDPVTADAAAEGVTVETADQPETAAQDTGVPEAPPVLPVPPVPRGEGYQLPPVELIAPGLNVRNPRMNKLLTDNIGILESTLKSFGIHATVTQVVTGPAVIRYELQPAPGIKVSRITALADDIAMSLAAAGVRIEAPIPGKSVVGIEVARKETETVHFREMIDSEEFQKARPKLSFALGKNIGGECIVGNLVKMPHLLIAGATGSGKSICINTIICSILYKATPDEVKMMLIDPKKVEMTQYARLPHLIAPVVNDSKKAANALKWVVNEMENRYSLFVGAGCKDFEGYNRICPETPLPHIVVIIDELADLMMVARHDVEDSICRLAQMARAAGIHLVVATQRPSVDVITGLIKANIPSRIAFAVSSYNDSRTILDMGGAEKLLGKGDMLYAPIGLNKPTRVQGTFISEEDVAKLVDYCCEQAAPKFSEEAVAAAVEGQEVDADAPAADSEDEQDELLYDAAMLIATTGQASVSFLQRRLAVGNPRAARLMDTLELKGVVGGSKGAKPRDILMSPEEIEALLG